MQGIEIQFKTKGKTDLIEGVIFSKDEVSFSGSHIDRSCSYSKLSALLLENRQQKVQQEDAKLIEVNGIDFEEFAGGLFNSTGPAVDVAELLFQRKLRNQTNRKLKRRKI
ncbi:MAG: hypothetical protein SPI72_06390 [Porphyromonas sp.]|nr:hypothetical protein [Porphyromonas sp.]